MIRKHHRHRPSSFLKSGWKATFPIFSVSLIKASLSSNMQKKVEKKCQNRHFTASKIPKYSSNPTMIGQDTVKEVSGSYSNVSILLTPSTLPESWFRKLTFYGIYIPCQFSWWSLNVFKIRLISAEIRIFESPILKILVQMQQVNDIICSARKMLQMIIWVLKYTIYTEAATMCWCYHFIVLL